MERERRKIKIEQDSVSETSKNAHASSSSEPKPVPLVLVPINAFACDSQLWLSKFTDFIHRLNYDKSESAAVIQQARDRRNKVVVAVRGGPADLTAGECVGGLVWKMMSDSRAQVIFCAATANEVDRGTLLRLVDKLKIAATIKFCATKLIIAVEEKDTKTKQFFAMEGFVNRTHEPDLLEGVDLRGDETLMGCGVDLIVGFPFTTFHSASIETETWRKERYTRYVENCKKAFSMKEYWDAGDWITHALCMQMDEIIGSKGKEALLEMRKKCWDTLHISDSSALNWEYNIYKDDMDEHISPTIANRIFGASD